MSLQHWSFHPHNCAKLGRDFFITKFNNLPMTTTKALSEDRVFSNKLWHDGQSRTTKKQPLGRKSKKSAWAELVERGGRLSGAAAEAICLQRKINAQLFVRKSISVEILSAGNEF